VQLYINIALIILAIALIATILIQSRGGIGIFGGDTMTGQYKTRRGLEKTLFQLTIAFAVLFFVLVIVNVFLLNQ
jgi:preprotein translocase subunit SecG